jgi:nitrogen fixation protein FixH
MNHIKKITLVWLILFAMFQTVQAVPSDFRQYPTSSPLITWINPHQLNVHYYHENFYIADPSPGPILFIDVSGDSTEDIKLETDISAIGKTIYMMHDNLIKQITIPETDRLLEFSQLTSIENLPVTVCRYPGNGPAITVNNPKIPDLVWFHEDIFITSPSQGPRFKLDLTDDNMPDIQIDCDTAAIGKTIYFETNGESIAYTFQIVLDNTSPIVQGLSDDEQPKQSKTWSWSSNENCTYRFAIDQNLSWAASGTFSTQTTASKNDGDGNWYIHVQAKDQAGNLSDPVTVFAALDNTKPMIQDLLDDSSETQSKSWQWTSNENSTFRFRIDQNSSWTPTGAFSSTKTATKNNGDGQWYLHVQAQDTAGNLSDVQTVFAILDNTSPEINNLSNDSTPRQSKTWNWSSNENCTYLFAIDQNPSWVASGTFSTQTTATKNDGDGNWYLHVQAKDQAGNLSQVRTVSTLLDNTKPEITDLDNDTTPTLLKSWQLKANETATFRFSINQQENWTLS